MIDLNRVSINKTTSSDLNLIYKISRSSFKNSWSLKSFKENFNNIFSKYFSLKYEENLVGFISSIIIIDEVNITNLATDKNYRRMGLAKHLLSYFLDLYKNFEIFLDVRESNISAINLYNNLNFKQICIRTNYYKNPIENAIIMKKF